MIHGKTGYCVKSLKDLPAAKLINIRYSAFYSIPFCHCCVTFKIAFLAFSNVCNDEGSLELVDYFMLVALYSIISSKFSPFVRLCSKRGSGDSKFYRSLSRYFPALFIIILSALSLCL